ncbi:MAG: hypothetical protein ACRDRO_15250 [Pseudonocardiaceae bacterium]
MIREDRELLIELARLNTARAPLALRMMVGSSSIAEQQNYAECLIAAGERLQRRATQSACAAIEGEVLTNRSLAFPPRTVESPRES